MINGNIDPGLLARIKPVAPATAGGFHRATRHATVFAAIREACERQGWEIGEANVGVSDNGQDMVAALEVLSHGVILPANVSAWLGVFNCNSRNRMGRFFAGITFKGVGMVFHRFGAHRQTVGFVPEKAAADAALDFADRLDEFPSLIEGLRAEKVGRPKASHLYGEAFRRGDRLMPSRAFMRLNSKGWGKVTGVPPGSAFEVLYKFSKAIGKHAPVSQCPRADQLTRLYEFYRLVRPSVTA